MENIDQMAVMAAEDDALFSEFAHSQRHFIINCAYRATKKYITQSDDEWSVSLIAFLNAVKTYQQDKGSFLPYAEIIIKRQLIDYYRAQKKYNPELTVDPVIFENKPEDNEVNSNIRIAVSEKLVEHTDHSIKDEIESINNEFETFGFSFGLLAKSSPKSMKTKTACKEAILYILDNKSILNEIFLTKQLPVKIIEENTNLPRKLLEHHRRYILAAIMILSGEYPQLAEYMSFIRKEDTI